MKNIIPEYIIQDIDKGNSNSHLQKDMNWSSKDIMKLSEVHNCTI